VVDEQGAEVAEWVVAVALITIVAVAIYTGILAPQLSSTLDTVGSKIVSTASG
jgi:Flp pilus assembly pilin Flp